MKKFNFEQMKRLYLIRHAKSIMEIAGIPDSKRKLLQTGINDTHKIVQYFLANSVHFDLMLSSDAIRALDTAKIIAKGLHYPEEKIVCDQRIYGNNGLKIFDIFYELEDQFSAMALVGHNPMISALANEYLSEKIMFMPTSAVVCIEFSMDSWAEIHKAPHELVFYVYPQML